MPRRDPTIPCPPAASAGRRAGADCGAAAMDEWVALTGASGDPWGRVRLAGDRHGRLCWFEAQPRDAAAGTGTFHGLRTLDGSLHVWAVPAPGGRAYPTALDEAASDALVDCVRDLVP